jgi:hypothetical protein
MPEPVKTPGPAWARWRAPIGYPLAVLCLWLARPTFRSILIGSALIVLGLLIRAAAAGHLRKREALAHTGPYARTRNPLYLGSAFLAAGFAVASWSVLVAVLVALYFGVFYAQAMRREEWGLREQYGKAFDDYTTKVPRFWPKLGLEGSANSSPFSFAQYVRNREYQATIGAVLLIAVLAVLATWRR